MPPSPRRDVILAEFAAQADRLGLYHAYSARECALFWTR